MPKNANIKKVVVIGSGPIVIGQAAEFDYAGTQACRSLKEEGICVVLINSNPATIMTDKDIADKVYIEPLTADVVKAVIEKEKPDSLLPTLGGQAALNIAMELEESGFLREQDVRLIGTSAQTIKKAEDRLEFKKTMEKIHEPVAPSEVVTTVHDGLEFVKKIGYPVVLRPAYTLGGSGGGIANNEEEFVEILMNGLRLSRVGQVLVERCIAGWKEIEYEVMRDANGTCITVCNMENLDPVGVHTGDSIVVAPSQTLADKEYQMLRSAALNIISELKITGGCNVQFALHPTSFEYCVIEVNPRVSRSSALASKATGYPIAKVSAKIALGYNLDEIPNAITKKTYASFEPALDYVVVKIPRLPFDKFIKADHDLTTQMKATGEVMSICTNFEGALMKALRSLEQHVDSLWSSRYKDMTDEEVVDLLHRVDDRRIYVIAEAIRRGVSYDEIYNITKIDRWFIDKIHNLVRKERQIIQSKGDISYELMKEIKRVEFPDKVIARLVGKTEKEIRKMRYDYGITASFKMVDTCAAEFDAATPYYYSCFDGENEVVEDNSRKKVMILGSGPIRIGQGIEFDYCSVHSTWAFARKGYETIIVNNNPETVSTDFDIADKLYFEPLTAEDVEAIVNLEKPDGAVVQFGGQTAIKLTEALMEMGVKILGTSAENVDAAEDRELFDEILEKCCIPRPAGHTVFTRDEALEAANSLGYPVLVRPSYVLGGQGMQIAISDKDIISAAMFYDKLFSSLDFTLPRAATGRRGFPKEAMVCAFIVMKCEGFTQITDLMDYLDNNRIIAHYCGFNIMKPLPSYWTYDRFLRQLNNGALKSIMANLVRKLYELGVVDASFVGLDSTPVMVNTKQNNPKSFAKSKFSKENHPKSDPDCALGVHSASNQHNERRYEFYWGYKSHVLVDCISGLPLCELTTPGNIADSAVAAEILAAADQTISLKECAFLADKGYDAKSIYNTVKTVYEGEAFISLNPRGAKASEAISIGNPICAAGLAMHKDGKTTDNGRTRQKFCCPFRQSKAGVCPCNHKSWNNGKKNRGCVKYRIVPTDYRLSIDRSCLCFKRTYALRTECERYNSRFKTSGQE